MPPVNYTLQANATLTLIAQFDPGMNAINQQNRDQIIDNIYTLWNTHAGGAYYQNFFQEIAQILNAVPGNQVANHKLRVSAIFASKLTAPYVNANSLGGYLGGASEILDTVRSLTRNGAAPTAVSIPVGHKAYEAMDFIAVNAFAAIPAQTLQDVDRTEIHPGAIGQPDIKYYIEVKADARTAVHKISTSGTRQLDAIKAVIENRIRRSQMAGPNITHHFNRHGRVLRAAMALTNPAGWLEVFTSGAVKLYAHRDFWLMVGGRIISPTDQMTIYTSIWTLLGLPGAPLNYYELGQQANRNSQNALRSFLASDGTTFPTPAQLAANNWTVAGLVAAPAPAQPIPQPPPPPP
jgi:hypothetical protein